MSAETIAFSSSRDRFSLIRPKYTASNSNATSCVVYALVDATEISGPATVYTTASASRAIDEPTVLVTARLFAPRRFASFSAASVSLVSPDWLITMQNVFSSVNGSRYRYSDAISTSTGMRAICSM